jgi:hypothetical protein
MQRLGLIATERCPQCLIGGALAAGFVGGLVGSWLFGSGGGGCSTCQEQINRISGTLGTISNQIAAVNQFVQDQNAWTQQATTAFAQQNLINAQQQQQLSSLSQGISGLQNEVNAVVLSIQYITSNLTVQQNNVNRALTAEFQATQSQAIALQTMWNATTGQITRISSALQTINQQIVSLYQNSYAIYTDRDMQRSLRKAFFDSLATSTTSLPSTLFSRIQGLAPMTWAQRLAIRNIQNAIKISTVHLLYTTNPSPNTYVATDLAVSFACDQEWLANNTMGVSVSFDFLFTAMNSANTSCYPNSVSASWTCACVVTIVKTTCQAKSVAHTFPWNWNPTASMGLSSDSTAHCVSQPQVTGVDPTQTNNAFRSIFTSGIQWDSWWAAFCTPGYQTFMTSSSGSRLRITSDQWPAYFDMVFDQTYPGMCVSNYATLGDTPDAALKPTYKIYQLWSLAYQYAEQNLLQQVETNIWGVWPTDLKTVTNSYNQRPDLVQTYRCEDVYYSLVSNQVLPVYKATLLTVEHDLALSVNGGAQIIMNGNVTNVPVGVQNVTMISDVVLSADYAGLIPSYFYIVGDPLNPRSLYPGVIHDVPWSLIGESGTPQAGFINYIRRNSSFGATQVMDPRQWRNDFQMPFDPQAADTYAAQYIRQVQSVGGVIGCGNDVPENGDVSASFAHKSGDYQLCDIMKFFNFAPNYVSGTLLLQPRQFTYQFSNVQVPGGVYTQQFLTSCPSAYQVTNGTAVTVVRFNTNQVSTQQIRVVLTQTGTRCTAPTSTVYSYASSRPLTIQIPACGNQYMQVYTLSSDIPCYSSSIYLQASQSSQSGQAVPPSVVTALAQFQDETAVSISSGLASTVLTQRQIASLTNPSSYATVQDALQASISAVDQSNAALLNLTSNAAAYTQISNALNASIDPLRQQVLAGIAQQYVINAVVMNMISEMGGTLLDLTRLALSVKNDSQLVNETSLAAQASIAATIAYIRSHQSSGSDSCGSGSGFFGAIFGSIKCWLEDLVISMLRFVIVGLLVVAVVCCFLQFCPAACGCCFRQFERTAQKISENSNSRSRTSLKSYAPVEMDSSSSHPAHMNPIDSVKRHFAS